MLANIWSLSYLTIKEQEEIWTNSAFAQVSLCSLETLS